MPKAIFLEPSFEKLKVTRTARYAVLGDLNASTKRIWIVCHGYAQLANHFILEFKCLVDTSTVIIAPEALNRFYIKGVGNKVGASWMTKEDRLEEISDYCNYLDLLCERLKSKAKQELEINVLGFSQGGATVSRWVEKSKHQFKKIIFYASTLPPDMEYEKNMERWNSFDIYFAIGDEDEFINEKDKLQEIDRLKSKQINFNLIEFVGGHKIFPEVLLKFAIE